MNQIEENAKYHVRPGNDLPVAYNSALYLTNRQVSWLIASLILLSFFIFIAGYFLGQRKTTEFEHQHSVEQNMLNVNQNEITHHTSLPSEVFHQNGSEDRLYKAQLIGFGTMRAAHQFADRLQQKNLPVRVQERHSKTAQGKEVIWYQVITELFDNKEELTAFVERIQKEERLKDIRIVSC